jgi:hypothetical protein
LHFLTFSPCQSQPFLGSARHPDLFLQVLESMRRRLYGEPGLVRMNDTGIRVMKVRSRGSVIAQREVGISRPQGLAKAARPNSQF